jgi:methionyl-tRNA formyltransferase
MAKNLTCFILTPRKSWFWPFAVSLRDSLDNLGHSAYLATHADEAVAGDVCFILSWESIFKEDARKRFDHNVVVHASDLPRGRGWSPMTWQVLEGKRELPLTLFEAADKVDAGQVYLRSTVPTTGFELLDDLRDLVGPAIVQLCIQFADELAAGTVLGEAQSGDPTFYPRRTPDDSRLDPDKTIREQFNLLRVVDNDRYPAFFELDGFTYELLIRRRFD